MRPVLVRLQSETCFPTYQNNMMGDVHNFLVGSDGNLRPGLDQIRILRDFIESRPETSATFKLSTIDGLNWNKFSKIHLEFFGSWPVYGWHKPGSKNIYVNPNYVHSEEYTDVISECGCGARLSYQYNNGGVGTAEHNHREDCKPYHKFRARADLMEKREETFLKCLWLGWDGTEISRRLGIEKSNISSMVSKYGHSMSELKDNFRDVRYNTQEVLRENGYTKAEIGEVYGVNRRTITEWNRS